MEIRQIQSFIMITQEGSFSKAAEILGYSQSCDYRTDSSFGE